MNYYEYAPPAFRWIFGNTNIKPWEMFPWFWRLFPLLCVGVSIFSCVKLTRKKNKIIYSTSLAVGVIGLVTTPFLNNFYLNYEWQKALEMPSYFINKQVQADSYASIILNSDKDRSSTHFYRLQIEREQVLRLPFLDVGENNHENIEFKIKDDACRSSDLKPYQYIEKLFISVGFDGSYKYKLMGDTLKFTPTKYDNQKLTGVYYIIKRDGSCFEGISPRILSRYYVIDERHSIRVGLGLSRRKISIVDSKTGDVIGYAYTFLKGKSYLAQWIFKNTGFGDDQRASDNTRFIPVTDSKIIEYRKFVQVYTNSERMIDRLIRNVLIPTHYFDNPEGDK